MAKDIISFDSKEFKRERYVKIEGNPHKKEKQTAFYSPLGVGVSFKNTDLFEKDYVATTEKYAKKFNLPWLRPFFSSNNLKMEMGLGLRKTIPFCDNIVKELEDYIGFIHVSYVILPPNKIPSVSVGGEGCPKRDIDTQDFLRNLSPMFSYLTAWTMLGKWRLNRYSLLIDSFRSKMTYAWAQLTEKTKPIIFPKGDECNPFISFADIIAFLTDVKLYTEKLNIKPENIEKVWEDYDFDVSVRFLDEEGLTNYKWHTDELIDYKKHLARPAVFLMIDQIEKIGPKEKNIPPEQTELEIDATPQKPKKFHQVLRKLAPYHAAAVYAYMKGGCVQFFDRYIDSDKVRDGDVIIYMGNHSKQIAQTYGDGFDVEIMRAKELREKVKKMIGKKYDV